MRGGSKGIKNKNLKKLKNKYLMEYTINQAIDSGIFETIAVSTDSKKIFDIAKKLGAKCWFLRSKKLAHDKSGKLQVIKDLLIRSERKFKITYDYVVDLDVTAPLRSVSDIKRSINLLIKNKKKNLITITNARRNPYFNMIEIKNNIPSKVKRTKKNIKSRQAAPKVFDLSASIFIWRRDCKFTYNELFTINTQTYYMPEERAIDIDTNLDLNFIEFLLNKK
tara:strand:- start:1336 stop:2001 length:666 start_codon:yes stop_codon:yes gene_type:complete